MALLKKGEKKNVFVKVLMAGTSGSGKTFSALRMATGMAQEIGKRTGKKGKILFLETESGRGLYYAEEFDFDYMELKEIKRTDEDYDEYRKFFPKIDEPFSPENYIAVLRYAVDNDYDIIVMDSLTHEWSGKGGILDSANMMTGDNFTKWKILTPRHNNFLYEVIKSPIHVVATVRSKTDYAIEENNGKKQIKKVGLGNIQRDEIEFEYTVSLKIDNKTHVAESDKDNTHLFDSRSFIVTEEDGSKLIEWANTGSADKKDKEKYKEERQELDKTIEKNVLEYTEIKKDAIAKLRAVKDVLTQAQRDEILASAPDKNPNKISNMTEAEQFLAKVEEVVELAMKAEKKEEE
jgi:hypothetical protein